MPRRSVYSCARAALTVLSVIAPPAAHAATISVPAGGDLQAALDAARPGDTILLAPGATFVGNFVLPVHGGTTYVTVRSAADDSLLPPAGTRISPAFAAHLPKIVSPTNVAPLRTRAGAAYWRLMFLEIGATTHTSGTSLELGDGDDAQNAMSLVPHHLIVDRVYIHGHPSNGQKRGIGLNSAHTTIVNSHVADIKLVAQDSQAIGGWNGPGPFHIENNYLEAAGEVILLGGDDPRITDLVSSDVTIRGNTITRPLSWRNPILATPGGTRASLGSGSLPAGTYGYRVIARRYIESSLLRSTASAEVTVTAGAGSSVTVQWSAVPGATEYLVYGRTPGAQTQYWRVTTTTFTDTGAAGALGAAPKTAGTVWQVKNLLEFKNTRRAQVDYNLLENNWAQAQTGIAVVFTPRNQYNRCTWCVVEDITFEHNVVRHTGGGISILGWDDEAPAGSQQTKRIRIRHNEFSDLTKAWGGDSYFLYIIDNARDIVVDHNTVIGTGAGILIADGRPTDGFVFTNNVMRHNSYGIFGADQSPGNGSITAYFPGAIITRNVIAGGQASVYPAGNEFPSLANFEAHFVDYAGGDFALVPGTNWAHAGTDGLDLGADMTALRAGGDISGAAPPLHVLTTALQAAREGEAYWATLDAQGGTMPYRWSVVGTLPAGLSLDPLTGTLGGAATVAGDYSFGVQVSDASAESASQPLALHVDRVVAPVSITTATLANAMVTVPYAQALDAAGGLGTYRWSLASGTLPAGLSLAVTGMISGTPAAAGSSTVSVKVVDGADASRWATRSFTIVVGALQMTPRLPAVSLTAPAGGAVFPVGATISLAAQVSDPGSIERVDFYVENLPIGVGVAPGFGMAWQVPAAGTYTFKAVAVGADGQSSASAGVTITGNAEVVIFGWAATNRVGNYVIVTDATAAGGRALSNPNKGAPKLQGAMSAPASYAEFTFYAQAGRPYHFWIRARADRNDYSNDSAFFQFDGVAGARIGTTGALIVNLEDGANAGLSGWGWQDQGYGIGVAGAPITFERTGLQKLRVQPREDGLIIDQIVLSPAKYLTASPGGLKNDTTILSQCGSGLCGTPTESPSSQSAVSITTSSLAAGVATVAYTEALQAAGASAYQWVIAGGTLPGGLALSSSGVISGTPAAGGSSTFSVKVVDVADPTRSAARTFTLVVNPPPNKPPTVSLTTPVQSASFAVGSTISLAAQAADADGSVQRVDYYVGGAPIGAGAAPGYGTTWQVPAAGTYTLKAVAVDDDGATASSAAVTITSKAEVVLYGWEATRRVGNYVIVSDATAAGGRALANPNLRAAKLGAARATPASYAEFTFYAEAGRPYHFWIRARAIGNDYSNDSAFFQFDGVAGAKIGTTGSLIVNLEDGVNAGLSRWGWQDQGYGIGVLGAPITFERTGIQTLRVQPREDGLIIDQIVVSPTRYLTTTPGALKDDTTIVQR